MNSETKNKILFALTFLLLIAIVFLAIKKNNTTLQLELVKQNTAAKIKSLEVQRDQLTLEKMFLKHTADSLLEVAMQTPATIYKTKIKYENKIDSVLVLPADKRLQLFTDRTRKGFRHN